MMTLVITFFSIPIGILLLINERKNFHKYEAIFSDFLLVVQSDDRLDDKAKLARLRAMLEHNHYHILWISESEIAAEKKLFSPGWLSIGIGAAYLGALIYMFYYFKFQRPHLVTFTIKPSCLL